MLKRFSAKFQWWIAGVLFLSLPFTSFPLAARLMGSSMVAPLAVFPLLALLLFWLLPYLLRSGVLPPQVMPLFGFLIAAIISMIAAFFLPFPPYKSASLITSELEAFVTLGIGVCFYLVIATWIKDRNRLGFVLRGINWSGFIILAWSLFQAYSWYSMQSYPDWMWDFQASVSTSLLLYGSRVNGFAYEPSWLSHQLNMLYLPFWLAATVSGFTAHRWRFWKIHFELILLLGGLAVLVLSISRIGMLTFMVMLAYLFFLMSVRLVRKLPDYLLDKKLPQRAQVFQRRLITSVAVLIMLVFYTGAAYGIGIGISKYDARMARLFDFTVLRENSFFHYANQLVFAERIVYWQVGWEVFNDYPILGVGLGNAGFFFPEKLSAFSWALTEIRTLMYQWTELPNTKSLWVRLLAETGIIGFALFACWCYVLWLSARFLYSQGDRLLRTVGLAGSFVLVGFLVEGFSVDTFALPYYWISFGLITAACVLAPRFLAGGQSAAGYEADGGLHL
jgi:O-antigen ligase